MSRWREKLRIFWNPAYNRPQNRWMCDLAAGLVISPVLLAFPFTLMFLVDPLWMFDDLQSLGIFAAFYLLPWMIAGSLFYLAATHGAEANSKADEL